MKKINSAMIIAAVVIVLGLVGVNLPPQVFGMLPPEAAAMIQQFQAFFPKGDDSPTASTAKSTADVLDLPDTPSSFSRAKRILYGTIYQGHETTFYCGCDFDSSKRTVNLASCGVEPRKNEQRAQRIEAEHVFPAYHFGQHRQCWQEPEKFEACVRDSGKVLSGRQCCEKVDKVFHTAHNDLHNLFPAVGEINGDRSNYRWGMIAGEKRVYGGCNIEVDSSIKRAEPPEHVWGDIARVYFYMSDTYSIRLSDQQQKLFTAWSKQDPPDAWEVERNNRIKKIQGVGNQYIENY